MPHRFMGVLRIEFFEETHSVHYQTPTGARLVDGVWESCVYVYKGQSDFCSMCRLEGKRHKEAMARAQRMVGKNYKKRLIHSFRRVEP